MWAVGANGTIRYFNGSSWVAQTSGHPTVALRGIEMHGSGTPGSERGLAVGDSGLVLYYNGTSWADATTPSGATLLGVARVNAEDGSGGYAAQWYVCGGGGVILHTRDSTGATGWVQETSKTGKDFHVCGGQDTTSVFMIGQDGVIEHRAGGNAAWDTVGYQSNTTSTLFGVAGGEGGYIYAGGAGGTIVRIPFPAGSPGTVMTSPTSNTLYTAASESAAYFAGGSGTVLALNDDATTWLALRSNTTTTLNGMTTNRQCLPAGCGSGPGQGEVEHVWIVGNNGLVLHGHR
jgi:hypothetical protein